MPEYTCDDCGYVAKQRSDYTKHINKKFPCTGEKPESKMKRLAKEVLAEEKLIDANKKFFTTLNKEEVRKIQRRLKIKNRKQLRKYIELTPGLQLKKYLKPLRRGESANADFEIDVEIDNPDYWDHRDLDDIREECDEKNIPWPQKNKGGDHTQKRYVVAGIIKHLSGGPPPRKRRKVGTSGGKTDDKKNDEPQDAIPVTSSNAFASCANACHNILRDDVAIAGEKAMEDIMRLMFLKFLDPLITGGKIDITDPKYYKKVRGFKPGMEKLASFSHLMETTNDDADAMQNLKNLWNRVLAKYPLTAQLFPEKSFFNCIEPETLFKLLKKINELGADFDKLANDVKGDLYEQFLNGYASQGGKDFGQYFTPREMVDMMFRELGDMLDGFEEINALDPFMGTGGFLTQTHKRYPNAILHGGEIVAKTFNLSTMNIILSTGDLDKDRIQCKNSITEGTERKHNFIPSNSPFGSKINYAAMEKKYNRLNDDDDAPEFTDIYPVKSNKGVATCLQLMVHKLVPGGICMTVYPDGAELYSSTFGKFRKYIMSQCQIVKIIKIKGKAFKFAGVSTVILYLKKTRRENKIMDIPIYEVSVTDYKDVKLVSTIKADKKHHWSWNPKDYVEQVIPKWDNCEWKELGEVCSSQGEQELRRKDMVEGKYPVIGGGVKPSGYHNKYNTDSNIMLCSRTGTAGHLSIYSTPTWRSGAFTVEPNNKKMAPYIHAYLNNIQGEIYNLKSGSGHPHVYWRDLKKLKIPVPSLEVQKRIVAELDDIAKSKNESRDEIKRVEKTIERYRKFVNPPFHDYKDFIEWKELGEVCEIEGGHTLTKKDIKTGDIPVIGGGKTIAYHNAHNRTKFKTVITRVGDLSLTFMKSDFYLTDNGFSVCADESTINKLYLHGLLAHDKTLPNLYGGAAQKVRSKTNLGKLKIPVPPLEVQKKFVKFYEDKEEKIKEFQSLIETHKKYIADLNDLGKAVIQDMITS